jgi:periplasmic divalent cation tolerance protein
VSEHVVVLSTVAGAEDAERIARELVERRLAACVNVVPGLVSLYRWKGAVSKDEERLLLIKTRRERYDALAQALQELHPYELPEIVALPVEAGSLPLPDVGGGRGGGLVTKSPAKPPAALVPGRRSGPRDLRSRR